MILRGLGPPVVCAVGKSTIRCVGPIGGPLNIGVNEMSTRCFIAKEIIDSDGEKTYEAVYCHYDGYNDSGGVGPKLRKYYTAEEDVSKLIDGGDIYYFDDDGKANRDEKLPDSKTTGITFAELLAIAEDELAEWLYTFKENEKGSLEWESIYICQ